MTEEKTKRALEIQEGLRHFTGSEQWYRHGLVRSVLYTEGVQFLAEKAEAYWLIDKIASLQLEPTIRAEPFQVWKLIVINVVAKDGSNRKRTAVLTATDGDKGIGPVVLHREAIDFTDFPLDEIELWVEQSDGYVIILLPTEH